MELAEHAAYFVPARSEDDLVAAVRDGNDRAFGELYASYESRIGAYIFGLVADHGRAEDIAQEVFISALRRLRDTRRPVAFKPWIFEIARNACIDEYRRARRSREISLDDGDGRPASGRLLSPAPSPDDAIESKQRLDDLRYAFRGLSDNHHRIIVMREFEGRSYSEIGARMGMSRPMVESTLFRARRRLGEEYQELVNGERCQQVVTALGACEGGSVRSLGIRQRRVIARHLAHCQPCRRHAWMLGIDPSTLKPRTLAGKIAAILPLPGRRFWRFFWRRGGSDDDPGAAAGAHQLASLQPWQTIPSIADPAGPLATSLGRVAAAVAAVVVAGGGVATVASYNSRAAGSGALPAAGHVRSAAGSGGSGGSGGGLGGSVGSGRRLGGSVGSSGGPGGSVGSGGSSGFGGLRGSADPGGSRAAALSAAGRSGSSAGPGFGGAGGATPRAAAGAQLLKASSGGSAGSASRSRGSSSATGSSGGNGSSGTSASGSHGTLGGSVSGPASGLGSTVTRTVQGTVNTVKTVTGGAINTVHTITGGGQSSGGNPPQLPGRPISNGVSDVGKVVNTVTQTVQTILGGSSAGSQSSSGASGGSSGGGGSGGGASSGGGGSGSSGGSQNQGGGGLPEIPNPTKVVTGVLNSI